MCGLCRESVPAPLVLGGSRVALHAASSSPSARPSGSCWAHELGSSVRGELDGSSGREGGAMPDPRAPEGPDQLMAAEPISVLRVRIGILLFLLWWLPVYVLAPAIADLIGSSSDAHLVRTVAIWLVCIQTVIGLIGLYLAGTQLFRTLGRVRRRRVLVVAWHIV